MCMEHIPSGVLFEKARFKTELSREEQSHLESCDSCRKELGWMQIATAAVGIAEPPQSLMDKVIQIGRNRDRLGNP